MPQFNELPKLSGGKFSVNAVNLMDHYHELRAGGVQVGGVPQILIRGGSTQLLEYNGPRMADSIMKEAMDFIQSDLAGGQVESKDALLGGATEAAAVPVAAPAETAETAAPEPLSGGKSRRRRSKTHHRRSRSRSRSRRSRRSRSRRHHHHKFMGGETPAQTTTTEVEVPELTAGKSRRRRRSGSRRGRSSKWIAHAMKYARDHNVSYKVALKRASASYRKK
jgi:hypothetical protein